jgi:superfamily I DNA/RNA helicase
MGWYVPFSSLSQTQVAIIEEITRGIEKRNHFICGFAGSGKSVLLTHVLERLVADYPQSSFVFLSFTHALVGMAKASLLGSGLDEGVARHIDFSTVHRFIYGKDSADFVFVDETQDLQEDWLDKIKSKARHVILAGDYHQSIYDESADRAAMIQRFEPKIHELREVFRLTPSLKRVAISINPSASNVVEADPVNSVDADIRDVEFNSLEKEVEWVLNEARTRARAGRPSALLFHHHHDLRQFYETVFDVRAMPLPSEHPRDLTERYINMNDAMQAAGIPLSYYGNKVGTLNHGENGPHVYLMTMHSAKGLDFKNVFLPSLNRGPNNTIAPSEPFQPRVCFVGVTRTFENLFLTHSKGAMEAPFDNLPDDVITRISPAGPTNVVDELFF